MKIRKLYVDGFRNIKKFSMDFERTQGLTILIGNNGTGKSNVLEIISAIFSYLYYGKKINFQFEIEYELNGDVIEIRKNDSLNIYVNGKETKNISKTNIEKILPSRVIALYSGEEERLNKLYYKPYINKGNKPQMIFINKNYWKIAFISIFYSQLLDNQKFIKEDLGISEVNNIIFFRKDEKEENNELLQNFYNIIKYSDEVLKKFNKEDGITGKYLDILSYYNIKENDAIAGNFIAIDAVQSIKNSELLKYEEREFYLFLEKMLIVRGTTLKDIYIRINNQYELTALSEGEKKLILIHAILEIIADENSIILFDEPDANIHEARKINLYEKIKKYAKEYSRQVIMTTHSPTIAQIADKENIIMLYKDNSGIKQVDDSKRRIIEQLTSGLWDSVDQNIFFSSDKPLIITEGIADIDYINKAVELLGKQEKNGGRYLRSKYDILYAGGAGGADKFIEQIKKINTNNRKIIMIFDADSAGNDAIKKCTQDNTINRKDEFKVIRQKNYYYFMLPKTNEFGNGDFTIEDYFSKEKKIKIAYDILSDATGEFNNFPNDLRNKVKERLKKDLETYTYDDMKDFERLLDEIFKIIDD